jgi:cyanophycinase-like exopeptidase
MIGPLALHGGGEFLAGDEPFLRTILGLAAAAAASRQGAAGTTRQGAAGTTRVELLTTAVARHRPDLAFAVGAAAFERVAAGARAALDAVRIHHARVVDGASAADVDVAERLASADLVYLPGGDPDAVIEILAGTPAWRAVEAARTRGAVVAGASAGAMALGERTWTSGGYVAGFGWAGRLVVVPHATAERMTGARAAVDGLSHGDELALVGLPERVGIIGGGAWEVVGDAGAWWWAPHAAAARRLDPGSTFRP